MAKAKKTSKKKALAKPASAKKKAAPKKKNLEADPVRQLSPAKAELLNNIKGNIAREFRSVLESHGLTGIAISEIHFREWDGLRAEEGDECPCRHHGRGVWVYDGGRMTCECDH